MSWNLSETHEGLPIFKFLSARDLFGVVAAVCRPWRDLREVESLWHELCERDFPAIAYAFTEQPSWAPRGARDWHWCSWNLWRARLQTGIICPGCQQDLVPELLELFSYLSSDDDAPPDECEAVSGERAMIPMLAAAHRIQGFYRQDDRSALPGDLFQHIVEEACSEFVRLRGNSVPRLGGAPKTAEAPSPEVAGLHLEDFLEYFRELLVGDAMQGESIGLVRSLRPWSTSATHNLIRLLIDPEDQCTCSVVEPPMVANMRFDLFQWRHMEQ